MNVRGEFAGMLGSNTTILEIVQFHGRILKMSVNHCQLDDYQPYFTDPVALGCISL